MTAMEPSEKRALPPPAIGWFPLAYSVGTNGQLSRLSATLDYRTLHRRHHGNSYSWSDEDWETPLVPEGTLARIESFGEGGDSPGPQFPLEVQFPFFDRLPDGSWIVAGARCWVFEDNASLIDAKGQVLGRYCLGDGISHLACDAESGIWVGYFDEGIYGNMGWGRKDNPPPIGERGLNRFNRAGEITWSYEYQGFGIDSCYAKTLESDVLWLYFYDSFPILRVASDGTQRLWPDAPIRGARIMAAREDLVVLIGGYEDKDKGLLLRLGDGISPLLSFSLSVERWQKNFVGARDGVLHFVDDRDVWFTLSLDEIRLAGGVAV